MDNKKFEEEFEVEGYLSCTSSQANEKCLCDCGWGVCSDTLSNSQ